MSYGCYYLSACAGFAYLTEEYGQNYQSRITRRRISYDHLPELHVGDVVLFGPTNESEGHYVTVLSANNDDHIIIVTEENSGGMVHWGRMITLTNPGNNVQAYESFWKTNFVGIKTNKPIFPEY